MKQILTLKTFNLALAARRQSLLTELGATLRIQATGEWVDTKGNVAFARGINSIASVAEHAVLVYIGSQELILSPVDYCEIIIEATFPEQP